MFRRQTTSNSERHTFQGIEIWGAFFAGPHTKEIHGNTGILPAHWCEATHTLLPPVGSSSRAKVDLRGLTHRRSWETGWGKLTSPFAQTHLHLKCSWRPTEVFLQHLGMKKLQNTNFNFPSSTGSQCEAGLGHSGAVINEENIRGVRVTEPSPAVGLHFAYPPVTHWLMSNPHRPDLEDLLTLQRKTLMQ